MSTALAPELRFFSTPASLAAELEGLAERLRQVTVRISSRGMRFEATGAGIRWPIDHRRLVITNAHVVPPTRGEEFLVETATGTVLAAGVVAREPKLDLALLELQGPAEAGPASAEIGDPASLRVGELVVALGHPFGVGGALSVGVLHVVPNGDDTLVQADIRLAPGNSGGPLATVNGAIIGVNSMIARGLGIAISSRIADRFARAAAR